MGAGRCHLARDLWATDTIQRSGASGRREHPSEAAAVEKSSTSFKLPLRRPDGVALLGGLRGKCIVWRLHCCCRSLYGARPRARITASLATAAGLFSGTIWPFIERKQR
jgi:hypothetical protein